MMYDQTRIKCVKSSRGLPFYLMDVNGSVAMTTIRNSYIISVNHDVPTVLFHKYTAYSQVSRVNICREEHSHHSKAVVTTPLVYGRRKLEAMNLSHVGQLETWIFDLVHPDLDLLIGILIEHYKQNRHLLIHSL